MSLLRLLGYATVTMLAMPVENAMTQQVPIYSGSSVIYQVVAKPA